MRRTRLVSVAFFALLAAAACSSSGGGAAPETGLDGAAPRGSLGATRGSVAPQSENGAPDAGANAAVGDAGAAGAGAAGGGTGAAGAGAAGGGAGAAGGGTGAAGAGVGGTGGAGAGGAGVPQEPDAGAAAPADAALPSADAAGELCPLSPVDCRAIQSRYVAAVEAARSCRALRIEPLDVCTQEVTDRLGPCGCPTWVGQQTDELRAVRAEWEASGCAACGVACEVGEGRDRCKPIGTRGTCKPNSGKPAESDLLPIVPGLCEPTKS